MEQLAYGLLELKPSEFFSLTPREFALMYKGFKEREYRRARYVQWLLSAQTNKVPEAYEIAGFYEDASLERAKVNREEKLKEIAELERELLH